MGVAASADVCDASGHDQCLLEPSYDIAGEPFDYAIDDDVVRVAIFDAMGHGFEATRMAMLAVGTYRHARRDGSGMEETRDAVDEVGSTQASS